MGLGLAIGMETMRACKALPWWEGLLLRWCGAASLPRELITASPREENIASVARFRQHLAEVVRGRWPFARVQVGLPDTAVHVRVLFADDLPRDAAERRKYLLWRLADVLDVRPERSRLAATALPCPLPGPRQVVLCAVTATKVIQQYERALAEQKVRYAGLAPSAVLLFNLFHRQLMGPAGAPVLLVAATEGASTTIIVLDGCRIFWRTRPLPAPGGDWRGDLWRDLTEAICYSEDRLGVGSPARLCLTGPLAAEPGLADWFATRSGLPVDLLDAGRLVRRVPRRLGGAGLNDWGVALGAAAHH